MSQIGICLNNDKLTPRSSGSGAAIGKGRKTSKTPIAPPAKGNSSQLKVISSSLVAGDISAW